MPFGIYLFVLPLVRGSTVLSLKKLRDKRKNILKRLIFKYFKKIFERFKYLYSIVKVQYYFLTRKSQNSEGIIFYFKKKVKLFLTLFYLIKCGEVFWFITSKAYKPCLLKSSTTPLVYSIKKQTISLLFVNPQFYLLHGGDLYPKN
jgi:hypothetical protein